jgi:hypothetical protein
MNVEIGNKAAKKEFRFWEYWFKNFWYSAFAVCDISRIP